MEGEREFEQLYLFACARGLLADVRPACVFRDHLFHDSSNLVLCTRVVVVGYVRFHQSP